MLNRPFLLLPVILFAGSLFQAHAALTVDRSRLIVNEGESAVSIKVINRNQAAPYLAQAWIEDPEERKLSGFLMALPPVQRIEANGKTIVRVKALPDLSTLPNDRESIFYFNLREIPPKSDKPNVLMLAMQTRFKIFYRPASLKVDAMADVVPGAETLSLVKTGDRYLLKNPTPYHFSVVEVRPSLTGEGIKPFASMMVAPKEQQELNIPASKAGDSPVLVFINDYGSQRLLPFTCQRGLCSAGKVTLPAKASTSGENHGGTDEN